MLAEVIQKEGVTPGSVASFSGWIWCPPLLSIDSINSK